MERATIELAEDQPEIMVPVSEYEAMLLLKFLVSAKLGKKPWLG